MAASCTFRSPWPPTQPAVSPEEAGAFALEPPCFANWEASMKALQLTWSCKDPQQPSRGTDKRLEKPCQHGSGMLTQHPGQCLRAVISGKPKVLKGPSQVPNECNLPPSSFQLTHCSGNQRGEEIKDNGSYIIICSLSHGPGGQHPHSRAHPQARMLCSCPFSSILLQSLIYPPCWS